MMVFLSNIFTAAITFTIKKNAYGF